MPRLGIRGPFLDLVGDPWTQPQSECARFRPDGLMIVNDGLIEAFGDYQALAPLHPELEIDDHRNRLIVPGFIDCHVHYPQTRIIGAYGNQLLDWLARYVFPEETRFQDKDYALEVAEEFFELLVCHGTTTAQSFATTFPASVEAFFEVADRLGMRVLCGLTGIDREGTAPEDYRDTPESFYEGSRYLIERYHGQGRNLYSICPRFALGSTDAQMQRAGQLKNEFPDCWVNTHLSENPVEIETVLGFYPDAQDYLEVYERYGLVGPRFSAGHSIHLSVGEFERMARAGAAITFCPSSNLFLGSGLFRLDLCRQHGVRLGLGCDSGAGNSLSMLKTLEDAYKVGMLGFVSHGGDEFKISALRGLYLATLGSAHSLYLDHQIGNFKPGKEADVVVLDAAGTPTLAIRTRASGPRTLDEASFQFFGLMLLGDERCVEATYLAGVRRK
ncbi:MAG: guanine deaminase [Candidatus Eremiobacteraeota bacterium]|nr:guanine deaminase [Candidatus Eremiobacteraeota bacterium]